MSESNSPTNGTPEEDLTPALIIGSIISILVIGGIVYFLLLPTTPTERIRDITIIFLGAVFFLVGFAGVVLTVQVARLINMVQTEVKPVLESANETLATVRGTAEFLSENLVEPVMKVGGVFAMFRRATEFFDGFAQKK
jgi:hypothetical protein